MLFESVFTHVCLVVGDSSVHSGPTRVRCCCPGVKSQPAPGTKQPSHPAASTFTAGFVRCFAKVQLGTTISRTSLHHAESSQTKLESCWFGTLFTSCNLPPTMGLVSLAKTESHTPRKAHDSLGASCKSAALMRDWRRGKGGGRWPGFPSHACH